MKKLYAFLIGFFCIALTANAQLGVPGVTLDPDDVPKFENDLPVIKDLGLRIDLTQGTAGMGSFAVKMEETTQNLLGKVGPAEVEYQTKVWGYRFPGLPATYPGATIVAMKDVPIEIKWKNKLPGHFLPVDPTLHMAHPSNLSTVAEVREWFANGNVPVVAHLHGGHTESASDGLPEAWFTQKNETGDFFVKKDYYYHNDQEAATLWYHDHALGITRLNVYAGLAGFYLLRDDHENKLIADHTLPGGDYEIEIVIQDRYFDENGQLFWPAYPGDPAYADFITGEGAILPPEDFPGGGPTALAEFFGNIILVNGKAWPKLEVEPRKYRFRLLNGSDSRFYILKLDKGAQIMVIGSDDGLLEHPVIPDTLVFAPGERYDVVVDFSGMEGENITMFNEGPDSPFGGLPVEADDLADPGTTGQIMQFQVTKSLSDVPLASVTTTTPLNTIDPLEADNIENPRQLALFEGTDDYGRLQPLLGTLDEGSKAWFENITETPTLGDTEIWEVYNSTGDAHPIHLHLVKFQIMDRRYFSGDNDVDFPQIQHNDKYGTGGKLTNVTVGASSGPLRVYEEGWKDTFIVPPGQVGRIIALFDRPGRYVWHCHILSHEDHEMMRPFLVEPPAASLKSAAVANPVEPELSGDFRLYPNPATDLTTVDFMLARGADVRVSIFGFDGRMINTEMLGYLNDGHHSIEVPVGHLDNGMYIFELKAGDQLFRETFVISK